MTAPCWPVDWYREGLIRADRYVAMAQLLCVACGKTGHMASDCGSPAGQCPGPGCYHFGYECTRLCRRPDVTEPRIRHDI